MLIADRQSSRQNADADMWKHTFPATTAQSTYTILFQETDATLVDIAKVKVPPSVGYLPVGCLSMLCLPASKPALHSPTLGSALVCCENMMPHTKSPDKFLTTACQMFSEQASSLLLHAAAARHRPSFDNMRLCVVHMHTRSMCVLM